MGHTHGDAVQQLRHQDAACIGVVSVPVAACAVNWATIELRNSRGENSIQMLRTRVFSAIVDSWNERQVEKADSARGHAEPVSAPMSRYVGYHQVGLEPGGNHRDAKIYLDNQDEPTSANTVEVAGRSKRYAHVATSQ